MPTLDVNGIECHGHYRLAAEGDPTAGEIGFYDYDELGTGIVQSLPEEDIFFVESPFWQDEKWADTPINPTFGRAARLLLSASGEVIDEKEEK